jgi:GTP-binding protein EngB required for normal cell division
MGNGGSRTTHEIRYVEDPAMRQRLDTLEGKNREYEEQLRAHKEYTQQAEKDLAKLRVEIESTNITSLDDLERVNKKQFESVVSACEGVVAAPKANTRAGFFGATSSGKSSMINQLAGAEDLCEVGFGHTTLQATEHSVNPFMSFFDMPGKNDDLGYLNVNTVSLLKSMDFIGIVVVATAMEMSSIMRLLVRLRLNFYVIVNQIDNKVSRPEPYAKFQKQIRDEVINICPNCPHCKGVLFVSAVNPALGDWTELVDLITANVPANFRAAGIRTGAQADAPAAPSPSSAAGAPSTPEVPNEKPAPHSQESPAA